MCTRVTLNDPYHRQVYLKDLRCIEGYDTSQVIIVDNSMLSFALQPENGIPISSYFFNEQDMELQCLCQYLLTRMVEAADV